MRTGHALVALADGAPLGPAVAGLNLEAVFGRGEEEEERVGRDRPFSGALGRPCVLDGDKSMKRIIASN